MSRGDQILRQWNLLRALQTRGQGASLKELVRLVQVSERTVQRDLRVLERLGFPVEYHANLHGKRFWRLPYDFFKEGPLAVKGTAYRSRIGELALDSGGSTAEGRIFGGR